jgi:tryptophan-rich sensory protein
MEISIQSTGLLGIVPQLVVILATLIVFPRLAGIAGWCIDPLAVWVAFASILNSRSGR